MSSSVAAGLWVAFSVGLLVGLRAEKAERRSPRDLAASEWVPAALGLLRAELVCLLGPRCGAVCGWRGGRRTRPARLAW